MGVLLKSRVCKIRVQNEYALTKDLDTVADLGVTSMSKYLYWFYIKTNRAIFTLFIWDYILWVKHLECEDKKPTMSLHELGPYSCSTFFMSNYLKVNAKSLSTYLVSLPRVLMFATAGSAICILILVLPTNKKLVFLIILFTVFPADCWVQFILFLSSPSTCRISRACKNQDWWSVI